MKIISFIEDPRVIRAILMHLALWEVPRARPPPVAAGEPVDFEYVPCADWVLPGEGAWGRFVFSRPCFLCCGSSGDCRAVLRGQCLDKSSFRLEYA